MARPKSSKNEGLGKKIKTCLLSGLFINSKCKSGWPEKNHSSQWARQGQQNCSLINRAFWLCLHKAQARHVARFDSYNYKYQGKQLEYMACYIFTWPLSSTDWKEKNAKFKIRKYISASITGKIISVVCILLGSNIMKCIGYFRTCPKNIYITESPSSKIIAWMHNENGS